MYAVYRLKRYQISQMISVENITKSFGSQLLFEGISFKLNAKERIGVVGPNGHGKTTLFRLITGEEPLDSGTISFPKNYRIGYVRQQIEFTEKTVLEEGMKGLPDEERDHHWKVEKILAGLGFSASDMKRSPDVLSGGYQVRLNLAKVLISDPDLLLLDEPTNYLDITSIRWIQRFLLNWPHEVMLITHDRSFMDKITTHTLGIHRKNARKITGNTEKYYNQIAQEEEIYEKTRMNDERRRKEIDQFISRFRAKARLANLVQSRIKTLQKMEKKDKLEKIKVLDFSFRSKPFHGKYVLNAGNLSFSYDPGKPLFRGLDFSITPQDRICVIGKNGKGKTTLLKLLAGQLKPQEGEIVCNPGIDSGFFGQTNVSHLNDSSTVEEEILYSHPDVDRQHARSICGAMMFQGDDALKKIQILSGGEKSRVILGKLLVTPVNLLLLDEPTNHLDMDSCDALLAAIDSFDGSVVMVTHNEMFLHALANRLVVFQDGKADVFEGSYQEFLEKVGWQDEKTNTNPKSQEDGIKKLTLNPNKKDIRRRRSEIINLRSKKLKAIEQQLLRVETDIEAHELKLQELNKAIMEASQLQNGEEIARLSKPLHVCRNKIDTLFEELEALTDKLETKRAVFDEKLKQLGNYEN